MVSDEEAALLRAAERIEKYGWRQGDAGEAGQPQCLVGAISSACDDLTPGRGAFDDTFMGAYGRAFDDTFMGALDRVISVVEADDWTLGIVQWNDDAGRTKDEVIDVLRRAAALTEQPAVVPA